MSDDQIVALISRTDAAMGLILGILLEKAVISRAELDAALSRAIAAVGASPHGALISSIFEHLQAVNGAPPEGGARH